MNLVPYWSVNEIGTMSELSVNEFGHNVARASIEHHNECLLWAANMCGANERGIDQSSMIVGA